jgi:hypothetical protein
VHEFVDATSFERWLKQHHASEPEVWIKIHKVGSGLSSITAKEAIDVVLCWGWIDAIRKSFDGQSFLQRYTPRGKRSVWSQVNVDNAARLVAAGRHRRRTQGAGDACHAERAEPLRTGIPCAQHEDRCLPPAQDRNFRGDAQARRDDLSPGEQVTADAAGVTH